MRMGLLATLGVVLASVLSFAAWSADEADYAGHGMVKSVDASAGMVTIDHEDIPGLMMGMTMTFSVSDPELLRGVTPGQVIDFRVRKDGSRYVVTEIRPAAGREPRGGHGMMEDGGCCGASMRMAPGHRAAPCGTGMVHATPSVSREVASS